MTPEEKSLLERTYKLVMENNTILRGIRRSNRIGTAMKVLYWVILIGLSVGALYFLQPYIDRTMNAIQQVQNTVDGINGTVNQAQGVLNSVKGAIK
jgi:hypothetical protein